MSIFLQILAVGKQKTIKSYNIFIAYNNGLYLLLLQYGIASMEQFDLVIIGGGIGGLTAAYGALYNGMTVAVIEKQQLLGGASLHYNCIPSKTLLHSAKIAQLVKNAGEFGLDAYLLPTNLSKVNQQIKNTITKLAINEEINWLTNMGGKLIYGTPRFLTVDTIQIGNIKIQGKKFILATGSRTAIPQLPGLAATGYVTTETIWQKLALPQQLIIIGGGSTGLEFAQAFARLGSKVIVIEQNAQILADYDAELSNLLQEALVTEGVTFYCNTTVQEVFLQNNQKVLICGNKTGQKLQIVGDEIFLATGRAPNTENLNLEIAEVHYDSTGVYVDQVLLTSNKNIYALGDVIHGQNKYNHVTEYQANAIVNHLLFKVPWQSKVKVLPKVIFTEPEFAQVGVTTQDIGKQHLAKVETLSLDLQNNDKAIICKANIGRIKLFIAKKKIIGATVLAPHAGEFISELALAINMQARVEDLVMTLHPYPTFSQLNRRVINRYINQQGISRYITKILTILNYLQGYLKKLRFKFGI